MTFSFMFFVCLFLYFSLLAKLSSNLIRCRYNNNSCKDMLGSAYQTQLFLLLLNETPSVEDSQEVDFCCVVYSCLALSLISLSLEQSFICIFLKIFFQIGYIHASFFSKCHTLGHGSQASTGDDVCFFVLCLCPQVLLWLAKMSLCSVAQLPLCVGISQNIYCKHDPNPSCARDDPFSLSPLPILNLCTPLKKEDEVNSVFVVVGQRKGNMKGIRGF